MVEWHSAVHGKAVVEIAIAALVVGTIFLIVCRLSRSPMGGRWHDDEEEEIETDAV